MFSLALGPSLTTAARTAGEPPPPPPVGFVFLTDNDGGYLVDPDMQYLMEAV